MKGLTELIYGPESVRNEKEAKDIYQVKEYGGKLWLTYNCQLICPTDMFADNDPIKVLTEIRNPYVERNTNSNDRH